MARTAATIRNAFSGDRPLGVVSSGASTRTPVVPPGPGHIAPSGQNANLGRTWESLAIRRGLGVVVGARETAVHAVQGAPVAPHAPHAPQGSERQPFSLDRTRSRGDGPSQRRPSARAVAHPRAESGVRSKGCGANGAVVQVAPLHHLHRKVLRWTPFLAKLSEEGRLAGMPAPRLIPARRAGTSGNTWCLGPPGRSFATASGSGDKADPPARMRRGTTRCDRSLR